LDDSTIDNQIALNIFLRIRPKMIKLHNHPFAPAQLYGPACEIIRVLHKAGYEALIAGGAVRDFLIGRPQTDLDIATSARPEQIQNLFRRTIPVGESFGVVIVLQNNIAFEVATFRSDLSYSDGRRPDSIKFCSAEEDAFRRDFTINGLFWDIDKEIVLDYVCGKQDIEAGLIRTILAPADRFTEDHLRIIRAIRFAAQLNFTIDPKTLAAIRHFAPQIKTISMERIHDELSKLFLARKRCIGLKLLKDSTIFHELTNRINAELVVQNLIYLGDSFPHGFIPDKLHLLDDSQIDNPLFGWLCYFLDLLNLLNIRIENTQIEKMMGCLNILSRVFRFSKEATVSLCKMARILIEIRDFLLLELADRIRILRHQEFKMAFKLLQKLDPGLHAKLLRQVDEEQKQYGKLYFPTALLNGSQLFQVGFTAGPDMGSFLYELETKQLEQKIKTVDEAHVFAAAWLDRNQSEN
jgi:poly(A) polymerase